MNNYNLFVFVFMSVLLIVDLACLYFLGKLTFLKRHEMTVFTKLGVIIIMFGISFQSIQCFSLLVTNQLTSYSELPLWSLKDVGLLVFSFFWLKK